MWVNDAMTGVFGDFLDVSPADYQRATEVNYLGFVNGTRAPWFYADGAAAAVAAVSALTMRKMAADNRPLLQAIGPCFRPLPCAPFVGAYARRRMFGRSRVRPYRA